MERRAALRADERQLELIHTRHHVEAVRDLCRRGGGSLDPDTYVGEASFAAALHAAGGACAMTRALIDRDDDVGFCAVRPAGHHAEPDRAMGFCLFGNVAIAAAFAIDDLGVERVLVIDWDVHHGNGTAEAFRQRRDVLVVSLHQGGLYPGTGAATDFGSGHGEGYTINLPVPVGSGERQWLSLLEHVVEPLARSYSPQLVLISAGFDAHRLDPLAGCRLEAGSFARMSCRVRDLAAELGAPLGAVLEGGYHLPSLVDSLIATLKALGGEGEAVSAPPEGVLTPRAVADVGAHWEL